MGGPAYGRSASWVGRGARPRRWGQRSIFTYSVYTIRVWGVGRHDLLPQGLVPQRMKRKRRGMRCTIWMQGVGAATRQSRVAGDRALDGDPGVVPAERARTVSRDRVAEEHRVAQREAVRAGSVALRAAASVRRRRMPRRRMRSASSARSRSNSAQRSRSTCAEAAASPSCVVAAASGAEDGLILGEASDFAAAVAGVRDEQRRRAEGVEQ